jgi:hypothetical protein
MRFKRRYLASAFASVAAFAVVGGVAFADHGPGNNTGIKCTAVVTNCQDNTQAIKNWNVVPSALPGSGGGGNGGSGAVAPVRLTLELAGYFAHPNQPLQGGKTSNVALLFDNDVVINLAALPKNCTANGAGGLPDWNGATTIAQAWEDCGPGADTAPEANAYLSPATAVSGTISTVPPGNFPGCALVFRKDATHVIVFARATLVANGTPSCGNPAINTGGNTTVILAGSVSNVTTPDYKSKLNVPIPASVPLTLDDLSANLQRASVFSARCKDTNKLLSLRLTATYSDSQQEQPPDTVTKTKACT